MAKINLNGKTYESDNLSDDAKKLLNAIKLADGAIQRSQAQLMLAKTAKETYVKQLEHLLNG